jgi:CheY-like chemotaxis protein
MKSPKIPVLYVDDEEMNLQILEMLLDTKFNFFKATSAQLAIELLNKHSEIEVVLTDWNMPVMDGLEFAKLAKLNNDKRPFIMISAYIKNNEVDKAIQNGLISSYLSKPFDREQISNEIYRLANAN